MAVAVPVVTIGSLAIGFNIGVMIVQLDLNVTKVTSGAVSLYGLTGQAARSLIAPGEKVRN
ncbi:hypothetical protein M4951_11410 [Blastopirellula sp. J2-11]|uniref:hypothetical protein n=1 Tax=Blastopirellula sp. J2-11 TaxID=2943192 RepID=UPI0021C8DDB0|nr:hypothetical protein [Blastopirellula sp. J2-11]UUO08899.1 hypothetical protein M4951_11410 [Blastopirellula sp. J2-11]